MTAIAPGPKARITADPIDLSDLGTDRADRAVNFIHRYLKVPKGTGAKAPFVLRPWQIDIVRSLLAPGVRNGLVSIPRANGKSALAAALAVWGLFDGPEGAQVLIVASDQRQAGIVFGAARRMIELCTDLADRVQVFRDRIVFPQNDGVIAPLPGSEPEALHGWDPSLCIVDELHVVRREAYEAMVSAAGKRDESLLLAISTPSDRRDSVMWDLVDHGRKGDDLAFAFIEYGADESCDADDEGQWHKANPALGDFLSLDAMRSTRRAMREGPWRQLRLGQWVGPTAGWLPWGAWAARERPGAIAPGARVCLGVDGAWSGDSFAIIACTLDDDVPHLAVVGLWERQADRKADPHWRVSASEIEEAVEEAFDRFAVKEMAVDPYLLRAQIETWGQRWPGRVIEWPTNSPARTAPAVGRLFTAVVEGQVTHDGNPDLARHVGNCTVRRSTSYGEVLGKGSENLRIDSAIAALVAYDRAAWHLTRPKKPSGVFTF